MKILMILDNLSCDSGVSSIVMNLYNRIDRNKIQIDFLIFKEGNNSYAEEIRKNGSEIFCLKSPLKPGQSLRAILNLKKFFKNNAKNYDIVHLHSPTLAFFTLKYAKKYGVKHRIVHSHSTMMSLSKIKSIINKYLIKKIPQYANHFWTCSFEAAKFLYNESILEKNKIEVIKNAVDISKFVYNESIADNITRIYNIDKKIVIAHISNFSPIKNHMFLIDIIKHITLINTNISFLFIGDGPTKKLFEEKINENDLNKFCIFTGRVQNVSDYLMISDLVILPSLKEGLPLTIVEAQASGVPCAVSDTITKEVNTGIVKYLPLKKEKWTEYLKNVKKISLEERKNNQKAFLNSQFNIEVESKRVEKLYMNME